MPQMEFEPALSKAPKDWEPARAMGFGEVFIRNNDLSYYMRLRPVSYILNSSLVSEALSTGKVLVADLVTGGAFFIPGDDLVRSINCTLSIVRFTGIKEALIHKSKRLRPKVKVRKKPVTKRKRKKLDPSKV